MSGYAHQKAIGGVVVALAILLGTTLTGSAAARSSDRAHARPDLIQVDYEESDDGSSPHRQLSAFAKRADAITFSIRLGGSRVTADSRFDEDVTDTDLHGESSHPWVLSRDGDGQRILRRIHNSLRNRGAVNVRVRAAGASAVETTKVRIVLADCTQDPPFYPVSCELGV